MMASASGELLQGGEKNLPPLSPNVEASQLLTPQQLERITIDNPHYREHLLCSLAQHEMMLIPVPSHQHVLRRRTAKLGDNYFFLQKDIPVSQSYARTALKLSEVRPWDQIVDRPLNTPKVINKEVHLPFPQEHPYTSHISRFAVFPDTNHRQPLLKDNKKQPSEEKKEAETKTAQAVPLPQTASIQTQTALSSLTPLPAYYVPQKAGEWGVRVEEHHISKPGIASLNPDVGRTFWDLPRSRQHGRANTYPAPRFLYCAKLSDTPSVSQEKHSTTTTTQQFHDPTHPHPAAAANSLPVTPHTSTALNSIHKLLTRTTTYANHFAHHTPHLPNGNQNILRLDYSLRSCVSQRPWTSESRGKYCRRIPMSPRGAGEESERGGLLRDDAVSEVDTDTLGASDGVVFSLLKGVEKSEKEAKIHEKKRVDTNGGELAPKATGNVEVPEVDHKNSSSRKKDQASDSQEEIDPTKAGRSNLVDNWTQTEEEYFITAPNASLPHLQNGTSPLSKTSTPSQPKASQANPRLPQVGLGQSANYVANPGQDRLQPQSRLNLEPMVERQSSQKLLAASQMVKFPSAKRPLSALVDSLPTYSAIVNPNHVRSYSADANLCSNSSRQVRTGEATKRLMGLYNGFNRTEVQRRFHEQYPQKAPDLREYSVREGRRHIIHGSHAYYFH